MIRIFRGDDSDFADLNTITVTITTTLDLTGYTGSFCFLGVSKEFTTAEIASKSVTFTYTAEETSGFTLGQNFGKFTLVDPDGRKAAVQKILVEVMAHRTCAGLPCGTITIDIENEYDYTKLKNKPKINGVEVIGEQKGSHYRLNRILAYDATEIYAKNDQVIYANSLWICQIDMEAAEPWDETHWSRLVTGSDGNAVHYTVDSGKTDAEKTQARTNISAASIAEVNLRVKIDALKQAVVNPSNVKLSPASLREYLVTVYTAIQNL